MSSTARSEALLHLSDLPLPVEIRGLRGATRLRLRIDQNRGVLKLTGPLRMNRSRALDWAAGQSEWIRKQLGNMLPDEPLVPGAIIPVDGMDRVLVWSPEAPRAPEMDAEAVTCGGPRQGFSRRVELFLRRRALRILSQETTALVQRAGFTVRSITVGDAATRWGSCSSAGRIRYSWRLILAPPVVRRYVVAHEVAHLAHLNHGPDFKAVERDLYGGETRAAQNLLRDLGPRLQRIGRGG